jgi:hypothetical protein
LAVAEADILGRTIGRLAVVPGVVLSSGATGFKLFNVGSTAGWIVPSPSTGGAFISHVSVLLTAGSATGASTIGFGLALAADEWSNGLLTFSQFNDSPAMFYANSFPIANRIGVLAIGQAFWVNIGTAFNAGTIATITCYGWTE